MKHFSSDGCVEMDYDKSMFSHSDDKTIDCDHSLFYHSDDVNNDDWDKPMISHFGDD